MRKERRLRISATLAALAIQCTADIAPAVLEIRENEEWVRLDCPKDVEPGSALDFSSLDLLDAPAGKHGWLRAFGGDFEFERRPGVPQRFWGVNLCFSACFPDHAAADALVARLARAGYNAVRLHHHDGAWFKFPERRDDFDYLVARLIGKGIYVTTDLYVSREAAWRDIGIDRDGKVPVQLYKALVGIDEGAFSDWAQHAREFLMHVNPYTGRAYLDEPAIPLLSLVNEGSLRMGWGDIASDERVIAAWRRFCKEEAIPDAGQLPTPPGKMTRDDLHQRFDEWIAARTWERCSEYVRALGCRALLTNDNCGRWHGEGEGLTPLYDYSDSHVYVDHPEFLGSGWSPPSRLGNANPLRENAPAILHRGWAKGASKPYVVSEWSFTAPGRFRGMAGPLVGALCSKDGWDGLWRFAYSHSADNLVDGGEARDGAYGGDNYFDLACDPLAAASDRIGALVFLRGASEDCRIAIDRDRGSFALDSPLACGGFTEAGGIDAGPLSFEISPPDAGPGNPDSVNRSFATPGGAPATICVASLDGAPVISSSRLLLAHLTDVQGDGVRYGDSSRTTLLGWGGAPLLAAGSADIELRLRDPGAFVVYRLDASGRRCCKVPSEIRGGALRFRVSTCSPQGGEMFYEIVNEPAKMDALGGAEISVVSPPPRYNAWPMLQALPGGRLVCAYSRGAAHTTGDGSRGVFARVSDDGAKTWSEEICVTNAPEWGEVTVGKGLDRSGAMLLWIRRQDGRGWGAGTFHDLWRTCDGLSWERVASPALDPHPIQITDIFEVPGRGLASLWFAGDYSRGVAGNSWGVLESADGGATWTQRTVESNLAPEQWPTEPCAVHLGNGRILAIARSESAKCQFQLTSEDGGATWKREKTNISDVLQSTPSLVFDAGTGLVANYYYQRGARLLKRRVAVADTVFANPAAWPEPEILARGHEERPFDAGNVNATAIGSRHFAATYSGAANAAAVFIVAADATRPFPPYISNPARQLPPSPIPAYSPVGMETGVRGKATGFFHVEAIDGLCWMVDPLGRAIVLAGVDWCTWVGMYCEEIQSAPYGEAVKEKFASAVKWAESADARLASWGFNFVAVGSCPEIKYRSLAHANGADHLYFSTHLCTGDDPDRWISPYRNAPGTAFPNVFHPRFAEECEELARKRCAPHVDDPWLVGYFLDNELRWGATDEALFDTVAALPPGHTARKALEEFVAGRGDDAVAPETVKREFLAFVAERYYSTLCGAIRKADPNHLILGNRFAGIVQPAAVIAACGRHCDVVSLNVYPHVEFSTGGIFSNHPAHGGKPLADAFRAFHDIAGKPLLLTEWSFPALDAGLPCTHGAGQRVKTQADRAKASEILLRTVFSLPFVIGHDFFMWQDDPPLGFNKFFHEDCNYGLVNLKDEPYAELTATFARIHREATTIRMDGLAEASPADSAPRILP
ncbi:MAG: exo-alpha-sialidase [Kiritimatiellae bacterium]|nr:exo-alpha-sialidase [Kiritimatiellia bacterium]